MTHAVRIHTTGGPGCMKWEKVDLAGPGPGEARLRHQAVGLNFIDVYHRTGLYRLPALPATLGMEAAGVVVAVGEGVSEVTVGDRVAYAGPPAGAYAEERLIPAHRLVRLPETIDARQAAAMMLKGMTARYLLRDTFPVEPGQTILLHAAAGGVGLIICQWARHLGATVIGTVGSPAKAELAQAHGCSHTILYRDEDFVKRVREITQGEGVHVVYDAVGRDTFLPSLDCLRRRGMLVNFGNASGPAPALNPLLLSQKGSLFLTRPTLMDYTARREDLVSAADELFGLVQSGVLRIEINQSYALADAARAHRDLEARKTTGSTVLIP